MAPSESGPGGPADSNAGKPALAAQRRRSLRAVFAADIAGFSGRMSLNETNTVNALSEIRLVGRRVLERHNGWLFGMPGDGLFATFESAVSAVQCALEMQQDLATRPHLKETPLRIGIHLGEVIIDDDLPYGETLNIAARLESLADPGGILVSGTVMDAVSARVSATFEDRGVPILKNIPRRIPTFAVKQPPARSPADETQVGLANLDRTTRLDRNALRQILDAHSDSDATLGAETGVRPPASPAVVNPPTPTVEPANTAPQAPVIPRASDESRLRSTSSDMVEAAPSTQEPEFSELQDQQSAQVSGPTETATEVKSRPQTLSEKLAQLPTPPAPASASVTQSNLPAKPFVPVIADPQLEKTLPEASPLPKGAATRPSDAFLEELTKALAVHVGPFSKLIVEREMKADPSVFELISKLEEHIPNDDERLIFRVRASHINASTIGPAGDV